MTLFANKKFTYTLFIIVILSRVDCWRGISRCLGWIPEWTIGSHVIAAVAKRAT